MYRPPRLIAIAAVAVVLLTAALPALWDGLAVVLEPLDPLFGGVVADAPVQPPDVRVPPRPFVQLLESRGPPAL